MLIGSIQYSYIKSHLYIEIGMLNKTSQNKTRVLDQKV